MRENLIIPRNKVAIAIPIHEPNFKFGFNLVLSSISADYDLIFVFTSHDQRKLFSSKFADNKHFHFASICIEDSFTKDQLLLVNEKRIFPTIKKLLAIEIIYNFYDYIICTDSELHILNNKGWYTAAKSTLSKKQWRGSVLNQEHHMLKNIMYASLMASLEENEYTALNSTNLFNYNNITMYSWWLDLPVYDCKHIPNFFNCIGWYNRDKFLLKLDWFCFDHLIYQNYTVLNEDYNYVRVPELIGVVDDLTHLPILDSNYCSNDFWTNKLSYIEYPDVYRKCNILAIYHIDR